MYRLKRGYSVTLYLGEFDIRPSKANFHSKFTIMLIMPNLENIWYAHPTSKVQDDMVHCLDWLEEKIQKKLDKPIQVTHHSKERMVDVVNPVIDVKYKNISMRRSATTNF